MFRVSISSDINGSAIGTGEIKKTHIHLLLLYIHIILQILSNQSHQLFIYINIQTFVYDAFLLFAIQKRDRAHASFSTCNMMKSCFIMIEERTKH